MVTSAFDNDTALHHAPITGVAPGAVYDPTIEFAYEDSDTPTVKRAAVSPLATLKVPVVTFEREVRA